MSAGDTSFVIKATDKTKAAFASVEGGLKSIAGKVFSLQGAIAGLAGAAGFGALLKSASGLADSTAKAADRLQISTKALTGMQYASSLAGVEAEKFNGYLAKMEKNIGQAATKGGDMAQVLQQTGLDIQTLAAMKPDKQFLAISDAISKMGNTSQRAYVEATLLGDTTGEMLNVMASGRGNIEELTKQAEQFGLAISRTDAAKIEAANDAFNKVEKVVQGVATSISVQLAPYVSVLGEKFAKAAAESGGFKGVVIGAIEKVTQAVAFMADTWRGLQVVWKLLEVAFAEFARGVWVVFDETFGNVFTALSRLPVIGDQFKGIADFIGAASISATQRANKLAMELQDLVSKPMPSTEVKKFFTDLNAEADKSAKKIAEITEHKNNGPKLDLSMAGHIDTDPQLANHLKQIMDSSRSENEILQQKYSDQQFMLDDAFQQQLISYETYTQQMQEIDLQHQAKLGSIEAKAIMQRRNFEQMNSRQQTTFIFQQMANLTAGVAQHNKALFEINKVAGIANAIINTYVGVTNALSAYPPPYSFVMAAVQLAAGMAQVNAIRSQSFGDGGAAPSLAGQGGGSGTVNTVPISGAGQADNGAASAQDQQSPQKIFNISISGNPTGQQVRDLIDAINTEIGDGAVLRTT